MLLRTKTPLLLCAEKRPTIWEHYSIDTSTDVNIKRMKGTGIPTEMVDPVYTSDDPPLFPSEVLDWRMLVPRYLKPARALAVDPMALVILSMARTSRVNSTMLHML